MCSPQVDNDVNIIPKTYSINNLIWFDGKCIGELKNISRDTLGTEIDFYCENEEHISIIG